MASKGNDWMIYGKKRTGGRYMAFDGQGFTTKIMFAIRFAPDDWASAQNAVDKLNRDNPEYIFEVRRGKGSIFGDKRDPVITELEDPRRNGGHIVYYDEPQRTSDGDFIIVGRSRGVGNFLPFDGHGFEGNAMRWPAAYRQNVMAVVGAMNDNNPDMEFDVARMPDTVFRRIPAFYNGDPLNTRYLFGFVVAPPETDGFKRPTDPKNVSPLDTFPDSPVQPVSDYPIDYSTQMFGTEIVTAPIAGRLTPSSRSRAIDNAIAGMTMGQASVLKSTIKSGTYYAVVEACSPELGSCQRILLTGRVLDRPDGSVSTFLLQSDTGSTFLDAPKAYLKMIDPPRTEADEKYRRMMDERMAGDGRPWNSRRYTVDGEELNAGQMVSRVSKLTGRTPWEVETTRGIRAMRVHDTYEANGSKIVRCFNLRGKRRR